MIQTDENIPTDPDEAWEWAGGGARGHDGSKTPERHRKDTGKPRISRREAEGSVELLAPALSANSDFWAVAGSLRRGKASVGDIDLVVRASLDQWAGLINDIDGGVGEIRVRGNRLLRFGRFDLLRVDNEAQWATALLYRTGSREENIRLRSLAKRQGLKLNEFGLWRGEERIPTPTEASVYEYLWQKYRTPEER